MPKENNPKEHAYFVKGMRCVSCEILIEKKLLNLEKIKSVESSVKSGKVLIKYEGERITPEKLNKIFEKENYIFSDKPIEATGNGKGSDFLIALGVSLILIVGFIFLKNSGLSGLINVNSKSSLPVFFALGLIAGVSSCAALVGGLILSMSKQWLEIYSNNESFAQKLQPHLMFNAGRIISYGVFGAVLGMIGSKLQISLAFTSVLIILISGLMILLALQMLGISAFRRFQFTLPRFIARYITNETNLSGRYMPFLMGAFTFFLPCGFTITAQGLALISGNPIQGSLIMFFFALGTMPILLIIGLSSVQLSRKPHLSNQFLRVAGILVLFFAIYNINTQLNVFGFKNINDLNARPVKSTQSVEDSLPPIVDNQQIVKMDASSTGYNPNYFKVRANIPIRWEITDRGTSGCTNAIISRELFDGEIKLTPGQVSIKEFIPTKPGKYKFSCWMGMISGVIEVVDNNDSAQILNGNASEDNKDNNANPSIPSGGICGYGCGEGNQGNN